MVVKARSRSAKRVSTAVKKVVADVVTAAEKIIAAPKKTAAQRTISAQAFNERVQVLAYEMYISRGASHGDDTSDWFAAEKIVRRTFEVK
ncbi:MAG: DUF2934 domain-containing protein [Candidatus Omnitrophica bacterium]|nr:DUF2934 domain-containing protein [Candidatus Omnitrophota bacterium]